MGDSILDQIYPKDPQTGKYLIHAAVNNYREIFNDMDPAPYKHKDLNTLFRSFLESCSADIPLKSGIKLIFDVQAEKQDKNTEEKIKAGLNNFFLFLIYNTKKERAKTLKRVALFTLISLISLSLGFYLRTLSGNDWVYITVTESFYIGGWVFFWEALAMLTFRNRDERIRQKQYQRLVDAEVSFRYAG